jgi:hypothetical protein
MAKRGRDADFRLDNAAGSLIDLSRKGMSINFSREAPPDEATAFQPPGGDREYISGGFKDNKFDVEGFVDATVATHMNAILGQEATSSFQIGPEGTTSGNRKYTGECFLTNYVEQIVLGVNKFTASFQVTGQVTVGTY